MAYNIIKGRVEFSNSSTGSIESLVDIWRNQSVGGTKTFTNNITASGYWDSTRNAKLEPLSTLISTDGANRVLTSDGDGTLTAETYVSITDVGANASSVSVTGHITGSTFSGSAHGLTGIILNKDHLAATNYDGLVNRLSASNIVLGIGMSSSVDPGGTGHGAELQVTGGQGITVDTEGVRVLTASNGGLAFTGLTLQVDASKTSNKGGGPSNNDEFIIADSSDSDSIKNLTYSQIKTAITDSISVPIASYTNSGDNRIITSVNSTTVNGEANLSFDGSSLEVSGNISVSGSENMPGFYIDNSQIASHSNTNIGINTDNPDGTLTVTRHGAQSITYIQRSGSAFASDGLDIGELRFQNKTPGLLSSRYSARILAEADGSEHNAESQPGRLSFWTCPTGTVDPVERMVINNSGNIGIGFNSPSSVLYVNGDITSSLGVHVTGSDPHISIGSRRGSSPNAIMLNVKPGQGAGEAMNNKILALFSRSEETDERTILAVTGSGKVAVGGANLAGVFNVSGSDNEKLVNVKSDSASDILAITGSGRVGVMKTYPSSSLHVGGNLTVEAVTPTLHFSSSTADLGQIGFNDSSNIVVQNNTINKHIVFKTNDASTMREGLRIDGAVPEVVVNQGDDSLIDFRVESANNTHMLFVDGGNEKVGINTDTPLHTLSVTGSTSVSAGITGSGGFHATGSNPHVAIGDNYGHDASSGMLSIRPSDSNNKVLCLMQSKQGGPNANRIIFGVTGSGQVLVGGAHFGGVLNVSGASNEKLISAKSNTHNPAFYVSGSGDTFQTGFLSASYIKTTTYTVADLPAAADAGAGARAFVTDASATTFASTVSDGGSNAVPVYSDGTNWKIG